MSLSSPSDRCIGIVGDGPEALILSVLFAESRISTYLAGPFEALEERTSRRSGLEEARWLLGIHSKTGTIQLAHDIEEIPISTLKNIVLVGHASGQQEVGTHEKSVRAMARAIQKGSVFTFAGLSRPGYTSDLGEVIQRYSGLRLGDDIGLCYLQLLWNGESLREFRETPRIIAGSGTEEISRSQEVFLSVFPSLSSSQNLRAAEAAGLFVPVYHEVLGALQLELASLCAGDGVDYADVLDLCRGSGLGLGSPRIASARDGIGAEIALATSRKGSSSHVIRAARRVNQEAHQHVFRMVKEALERCGKRIRRSRVAILGLEGLGIGARLRPEPPEIIMTLRRRGAIVSLYPGRNPWLADGFSSEHVKIERSVVKAVEDANCAIIALDGLDAADLNPQRLAAEMSHPAAICDLNRVLEASNVERTGLFYSSIGRGSQGA